MVNSLVDGATSDMLVGPDWALNIEICDVCNRDSKQSKDIVKGVKKRLGSKNSKVQLLALTLLEAIVKNCGDIVHMHIAEKGVLHEMVKIVKKKPEFHVKEKILVLVDTWQEAFGGPRARYPQFFAAYKELLRLGVVFPQRSDMSAPVFTPPQMHPLSSYPQNVGYRDTAASSAETEFPTFSLTEIQKARGVMDVLAEMLNALDPSTKGGLRQEVIVDLVEQCRAYKQRLVHLVNSTSDESLLCQGLALNDDLQRVLSNHEAIASSALVQNKKPSFKPASAPGKADSRLIDTGVNKQPNGGSSSNSSAGLQLSLPAPPATNVPSTTPARADPIIDLLSGDDYGLTETSNSLAIVPVGNQQPPSPISHQNNALVLMDTFSQNKSRSSNPVGHQLYPSTSRFHSQQLQPNIQQPQSLFYPNGNPSNSGVPQFEQQQPIYTQGSNPYWNGQIVPQQPPPSSVYGAQSLLPPPPWEAFGTANVQEAGAQYSQPIQVSQMVITHAQPAHSRSQANDQTVGIYNIQPISTVNHLLAINNSAIPSNQIVGFPQQIQGNQYVGILPQPMQTGQLLTYIYPQQMYNNQMPGYTYGYDRQQKILQQQIEHSISTLSVRSDGVLEKSSYSGRTPSYVHVPSEKPSEDKLFSDLVDISKFKSSKATPIGRLSRKHVKQ